MLADLTIPLWIWWAVVGFAGVAIAITTIGWLRDRTRPRKPEVELQFDPESGPRSIGTPSGSLAARKPFIPPPAPISSSLSDRGVEQRAAFRRVGNGVLIQIADKEGRRKPLQAWVMDRSRRGLRIAVEGELSVGSIHAVRPMNAPPTTPWCDVEIRHCEPIDGHWEAGCRFLQPPPVQLLMLFG
jgi:hypothetical protein